MNILILGGNGYLGSKVTRKLVEKGHYIVCTKRASSDLSRLGDMKDKMKWIPASADAVETAAKYVLFDYVINTACNYGRGDASDEEVIEANFDFPLKILNKVMENGTRNFISVGTGLPDELNIYSFTKKMFSEYGRFCAENHDINFTSLLLEMFYGPDEPKSRFLPSIICSMLEGKVVNTTLGTQHRDIIAIDDIVDAIIMVMEANLKGYNEIPVGTGIAPTIAEIVDYIWHETGEKSVLNKGAVPMRKNEADCVADTSFIEKLGEWHPVDWKQGISQMIKDMDGKEHLHEE